jgi:hypothetical protein
VEIGYTGTSAVSNTEKMFQRFTKSNANTNSLGLGLSIVKAICDTYLFPVAYLAENGYHKVAVHFPE